MLRNLKKPVNEFVNFSNVSIATWEKYFTELYSEEHENTETVFNENSDCQYEISADDVQLAVAKLKNRKSPGPDEITNEMLKYGGETLCAELALLFNKILENGEVPESWKHSFTIPIFKKGDRKVCDNYRGITLLSAALKLFTKILSEAIADTGIEEEQQGFRRNRSTIDAIFIVRQIVEKAIEFNKPAFLCFVDLTKAFDQVRLQDVLCILQKRNVDGKIIAAVQSLNTGNTTSIKVDSEVSKKLKISSGIRQGDSLSPILFNTIMDEIIKDVKCTGRGYKLIQEMKIVCYADDAVLISDNEDDLQRLLYTFEKSADRFNMKISIEKTKALTISKQPLRCKLAVYGKPIEQVMEFDYLGVKITSSKDLTSEVTNQANKAARIAGCLRDVIWRNKHMNIRSKVRIYKTCVRPVLIYGIETRADMKKTEQLVSKTEMSTLRSIAGFTRWDMKRNEEVRQICDVPDVIKWSRTRRKEWNRHVVRMGDRRLAKMSLMGKPNTSRPPGRPPKRWHECWTSSSADV